MSKQEAHWGIRPQSGIVHAMTDISGCNDTGGTGTTYCKGPFYRHFSNRNHADTQASMNVANLPCYNDTMYLALASDGGFIYLGGNTFQGTSNKSYATVDAGLQFVNTGENPTPQSFFEYVGGAGGTESGYMGHWACNQTVAMKFSEPTATMLSLVITGDDEKGVFGTRTTTFTTKSTDGWGPTCVPESSTGFNCQVKRTVGLGKDDATVFPDGSYFGVSNPGTSLAQPTITWSSPMEGPMSGLAPWTDTEYQECPEITSGPTSAVLVSAINPTGSETIGLQSQGYSPPSNSCVVYGQ